MASQRITIAKIGGDSGEAVIARFRDWAGARTVDDPNEWGPDQWPVAVRGEMDAFALSLRTNGHLPPVVYFNEHVDLWSMGDLFRRWFPEDEKHRPEVGFADRFELWCYSLPDDGMLANLLRHSTRLKRIRERQPQEDRWFTINLLEATLAWEGIVDTAAIVVLREVFDGCVLDEEIEESLVDVPEWIDERGGH